jgi:hypothetical protein
MSVNNNNSDMLIDLEKRFDFLTEMYSETDRQFKLGINKAKELIDWMARTEGNKDGGL